MSVSLLDANRLLLESLLGALENGSFVVGYCLNQVVHYKIRSDKTVKLAQNNGQDIAAFGVSCT